MRCSTPKHVARPTLKAALARVLHLRTHWPDGVKRYVASMYEMEPEAWERIAQFLDTGSPSR